LTPPEKMDNCPRPTTDDSPEIEEILIKLVEKES
jgi:hypothetical protein